MNNRKKEPDISVRMNGEERKIVKSDESFPWILPNSENVVMFEELRKKKKLPMIRNYQDTVVKEKGKRKAEKFLLIFFAIIIGGLMGIGLLNIVPDTSTSVSGVTSITLEPIHAYVEQQGVFSELSGAESVSQELQPSAILKRDKYYVLTDISSNQITSGDTYVKQISTELLSIENMDEKSGTSMVAIREMLNSLLQADRNEEEIARLAEQMVVTNVVDDTLQKSAMTAYELRKVNSVESKQALLQFFVNYDEFVMNNKK